jgi:hypothetical protein
MSSDQLRTLVTSLIHPEPRTKPGAEPGAEIDAQADRARETSAPRSRRDDTERDDPAAEFEARPTTCLPVQRASTIDQLIAALQRPSMHRMRAPQARRRSPRR